MTFKPSAGRKVIIDSAWNPICALLRLGDAIFLASSPGALMMVEDVMLEVAAVAQAVATQRSMLSWSRNRLEQRLRGRSQALSQARWWML
jgi:ketopantoate reductase